MAKIAKHIKKMLLDLANHEKAIVVQAAIPPAPIRAAAVTAAPAASSSGSALAPSQGSDAVEDIYDMPKQRLNK